MKSLPLANDRWLLLASLILQIGLGLLLGHAYDDRINLATGFLVGTGQNPYIAQDLMEIFHYNSFQGMTSIGYPPLWPSMLGLIYLFSYKILPNLLLYNLAIKIPIIAANLCLAFVVRKALLQKGADVLNSRRAWVFLLFNPFLLLATTGWGQIDSIVALLCLLALTALATEKRTRSAILLALAVSIKPIAIPLIPAFWIYLKGESIREKFRYFSVILVLIIVFSVLPFVIFRWDPGIIIANWNAHVSAGGGLSFLAMLNHLTGSTRLSGAWWLLGMLWLPALTVGAIVIRNRGTGFIPLLNLSAALFILFFLFRSWVSEPNFVMILPLILILAILGELPEKALQLVWILPLIFGIFNMAWVQLLFPVAPQWMAALMQAMGILATLWQILGAVTAGFWLVTGGWMVKLLLHDPRKMESNSHAD